MMETSYSDERRTNNLPVGGFLLVKSHTDIRNRLRKDFTAEIPQGDFSGGGGSSNTGTPPAAEIRYQISLHGPLLSVDIDYAYLFNLDVYGLCLWVWSSRRQCPWVH